MKLIPLTKGEFAMVDDEEYEHLMGFSWRYCNGYAQTTSKHRKSIKMHRMIMNAEAGAIIDHKDRNKLNNQRSNLRACRLTDNSANTKSRKGATSHYLGVYLEKGRWAAQVRKFGIKKRLGLFDTPEEAAIAYNIAAIEIHGEFANLNILP